jgi:transposase
VVVERAERLAGAVETWGRVATATACCWACGATGSRVHSRYQRHLEDAAAGGQPVIILLTVRRFFCPSPDCGRQTFAEQVPDLTWRYGLRTPVARRMLEAIRLALGGRAGARLAAAVGLSAGRATSRHHAPARQAEPRSRQPREHPNLRRRPGTPSRPESPGQEPDV